MHKDNINQALRLLAMGRVGHPLVEELSENLERVFASVPRPAEVVVNEGLPGSALPAGQPTDGGLPVFTADTAAGGRNLADAKVASSDQPKARVTAKKKAS